MLATIKYFPLFFLLMTVMACQAQKIPIQQDMSSKTTSSTTLSLVIDTDGKTIETKVADDKLIPPLPATSSQKYFLGILKNETDNLFGGGQLELLSWSVPLITIRMMEAQAPKSLLIPPDKVGKLAIVSGTSQGNTIYEARIVAVFEDKPLGLLYKLLHDSKLTIDSYLESHF